MFPPLKVLLPRLLRCDLGTENANLAFLQPFPLRQHGTDCFAEFDSFRYGKSVSNQVCASLNIDAETLYATSNKKHLKCNRM